MDINKCQCGKLVAFVPCWECLKTESDSIKQYLDKIGAPTVDNHGRKLGAIDRFQEIIKAVALET